MKKILFATALSFLAMSFSSFAVTVDQFCNTYTWDSEKIACYKTVGRNYIDLNALDICYKFSFDSDRTNCLNTILNKTYNPGEVKICRDQNFDSEKVKCLVDLGTRYNPPGDDRRMDSIRKLTIVAQDYLRRNDLYNVARTLDQIYQISNSPALKK